MTGNTLPQIMIKQGEERQALTATEMKNRVQTIQQVQAEVMSEGTHYGKLPGTDKPALYKPGAEVLCVTFHIAPTYEIEDLSVYDDEGEARFIRYRMICRGVHQQTSMLLGDGVGECSTMEEKYKWKKAYSGDFNDADPSRRRLKRYGQNEVQQIRTEPFDLANTVLKMAAKRAQVAMTLNVLAASDMFTQDLEEGGADDPAPAPDSRPEPQATSAEGMLQASQKNMIRKKLESHEKTESALCKYLGVGSIDAIPFSKINDALKWIEGNA